MTFDDVCSKLNMTTDSAKYRTLGFLPSGVASAAEAALGLTEGEASAGLWNASATAGLEVTARSLGLIQAEVEAAQRVATASSVSDLLGTSTVSSYAKAVRTDLLEASGLMMAEQAALAVSNLPDAARISEMSLSTAAGRVTANMYANSISEQFADTSGCSRVHRSVYWTRKYLQLTP